MITEAKELWIETALDKGWPVPEPQIDEPKEYSGKFLARLPRSLHRELVELAEEEGTSLNQLVVMLLSRGIERRLQHRWSVWTLALQTTAPQQTIQVVRIEGQTSTATRAQVDKVPWLSPEETKIPFRVTSHPESLRECE
jgi:hypothetical protein